MRAPSPESLLTTHCGIDFINTVSDYMRWSDLFVRPIPSNRDTNPEHWKFLFFYYNSENPRLLVPRRWTGNPFTVNFARPTAWIVAVVFVIALIVLIPFNHDSPALLRAIRHLLSKTS